MMMSFIALEMVSSCMYVAQSSHHTYAQEGPVNKEQNLILTKGAPEAILPLLVSSPSNYSSTYLHHMGRGRRVLALAYR